MTREEAIEDSSGCLDIGMTLKMTSDVFGVMTTKPLRLPSPPSAPSAGSRWRRCGRGSGSAAQKTGGARDVGVAILL